MKFRQVKKPSRMFRRGAPPRPEFDDLEAALLRTAKNGHAVQVPKTLGRPLSVGIAMHLRLKKHHPELKLVTRGIRSSEESFVMWCEKRQDNKSPASVT